MKTKAKIMIVDDAEMNREILMVILGDEYEYVQAGKWASGHSYSAAGYEYRFDASGY